MKASSDQGPVVAEAKRKQTENQAQQCWVQEKTGPPAFMASHKVSVQRKETQIHKIVTECSIKYKWKTIPDYF